MTERLISLFLIVIAVIHLLPIAGFLGTAQLETLYGIEIADPNEAILMRHRAVLFGILGGLFAYAAFRPAFQLAAFVAAFVSTTSFLWLARATGNYNDAIWRVVIADIIAAICLVLAVVLYLVQLLGSR